MVASPTGIRQSRLDRERKKPGRQLETSCGRAPGSVCNRYGALKDDKGAPRGAEPSQAPATMRRNSASCKKCAGSMRGRCCRLLPLRWIRCSSLAWCAAGRCRSCSNFIVHVCLGLIATVVVRCEVGCSEHPSSPVPFFSLLASSLWPMCAPARPDARHILVLGSFRWPDMPRIGQFPAKSMSLFDRSPTGEPGAAALPGPSKCGEVATASQAPLMWDCPPPSL